MDDQFFSKMAKSVSEFMILAILKEKGESHTYELQQTLLAMFSNQKAHATDIMNVMELLKGKIKKAPSDFVEPDKSTSENLHKDRFEYLIHILANIMLHDQKDEELSLLLTNLISEVEIINNHIFFPIKIWESISAIYQVMKELESHGFITIARNEIVNGRTRKVYRITEKGELEAIRMIFIFNAINHSIYPQIVPFEKQLGQFYTSHINNLNNLFSRLMKTHSSSFTELFANESMELLHTKINPFVDSQYQMVIQILSLKEFDVANIVEIFSFNNKKQNTELISQLKNYKNKLETLIDLLA